MAVKDFVVRNGLQVTSNVGVGTSTITSGTRVMVKDGNVNITTEGFGVVFPDGTFQTSASTGGGGSSVTTSIVTGTTQTAVKDYRYVLTNAASTTVTLPASPSLGDTVYIMVANDLTTNVVARNGKLIMGSSEDMTIDINNFSFGLVFVNNTIGWRLI